MEEIKKKRGQKKGHTGNPYGRPKKQECLTLILDEIGELQDVKYKDTLISRKIAIAQKLWALALGGDMVAIKYVYDRLDGSPRSSIDVKDMDGGITVVFAQNMEGI